MHMHWWVELAGSGFMGFVVAGLLAALALLVVLTALTGVLHGIAGARSAFGRGFRRGWDRPARDTTRQ